MSDYTAPIRLESGFIEITDLKYTKAKFWEDIEVGDILKFHFNLIRQGRASKGLYAVNITVTNLTQGESKVDSLNMITRNLSGFGYDIRDYGNRGIR